MPYGIMRMLPQKGYLTPWPSFSGQRERQLREDLIHKAGCRCKRCGESVDFYQWDFHHTSPKEKRFTLDQETMKSILDGEGEARGLAKIMKEFAKTILLCRPCHKEVHKNNEQEFFTRFA